MALDERISAEAGSSRVLVSENYGESTTISGSVDFERDVGILNWTFSGDSTGGKVVYTPDLMYQEGRSGRWLVWGRCDFARPVLPLAYGGLPSSSSPTELLRFLVRVGTFEKLGDGVERGIPVTRYRVTVDVERMLEEIPRSARKGMAESIRLSWPDSQKAGIPVEVSLDKEGRMRRANLTYLTWWSDGDGIDLDRLVNTTLEFFDYGVDVNAKGPPVTDEIVPRGDPYRCLGKEEQ